MIDKQRPDWNAGMQGMFTRISKRYDLLNTILSLGQDRAWRDAVLRSAELPDKGSVLDVGTGTGEIALDIKKSCPQLDVVALDLTTDMMKTGRDKPSGKDIRWINGDALAMPFSDMSFTRVTSGYLLRNVPDLSRTFREQLRVVKPGGKVVSLDFCPPRSRLLKPLLALYFRFVIPVLGGIVSGHWDAYRYLPDSINAFKSPEELSSLMEAEGFVEVNFQRFMFDTVFVLCGTRPA